MFNFLNHQSHFMDIALTGLSKVLKLLLFSLCFTVLAVSPVSGPLFAVVTNLPFFAQAFPLVPALCCSIFIVMSHACRWRALFRFFFCFQILHISLSPFHPALLPLQINLLFSSPFPPPFSSAPPTPVRVHPVLSAVCLPLHLLSPPSALAPSAPPGS